MHDLRGLWPHILALLMFVADVWATCHAVLHKRDTRAALGWVGVIWFLPAGGSVLYFLFGINRIQRRARSLRTPRDEFRRTTDATTVIPSAQVTPLAPHLSPLARVVGQLTTLPLVPGNTITPLDRHSAYPTMLAAIEQATESISFASYIFDDDETGARFVRVLADACQRGVAVRVLVDDVGSKYSWPSIVGRLQRANIPCAAFLPRFAPWAFAYANLRNHRKLLIVDGTVGFTGGMNIRHRQSELVPSNQAVDDLHFQLTGPIVAQLQHVFVDDWNFTCNENLTGTRWFPELAPTGSTWCRGIPDGPDENMGTVLVTLEAALACAQHRVIVATPYFLPDRELISAMNLAAMRGVVVDIVLPRVNNLRLVEWASMAIRWQVLERGCRIWLTPPPFDHAKLMLVDSAWTLLGSSNWDPRSLRLNFEFNVECYDPHLANQLQQIMEQEIAHATQLTLADVDGRHLLRRLRDGTARLLTPYL